MLFLFFKQRTTTTKPKYTQEDIDNQQRQIDEARKLYQQSSASVHSQAQPEAQTDVPPDTPADSDPPIPVFDMQLDVLLISSQYFFILYLPR